MSAGWGAKMASTPADSSFWASDSKGRGYLARSSFGANWGGVTKIEVTTCVHSRFARSTSDMWPAWSAPIVGTRPTILFSARARRADSFIQATVRIVSIGGEFTGNFGYQMASGTSKKIDSPQSTQRSQRLERQTRLILRTWGAAVLRPYMIVPSTLTRRWRGRVRDRS